MKRSHLYSLTAGSAIAVGAMALSAPAANAETFQQSCTTNPGAYAAGAVLGAYSTQRSGEDRIEFCKVYDVNKALLGTTNQTDYGWYTKHGPIVPPVSPPPLQK